MTDQEWLACTDPSPMMDFLRGKASERKLRLFACGCWRLAWRFLTTEEDRNAVVVAERYADGQVSSQELPVAFDERGRDAFPHVCYRSAADAPYHADVASYMCALRVAESADDLEAVFAAHRGTQADLVREIFGSLPFSYIPINSTWLVHKVSDHASMIYDKCAFDRLPLLADDLEDAGCDNTNILNHCRCEGPHVRGCWVVDLLLGKE
jgi:hypothetical protein